MSYQLTRDEFKVLLKNTQLGALSMHTFTGTDYGVDWTLRRWYSKKGELRFSQLELEDGTGVYEVYSELTDDEVREPNPELRIEVKTFEEFQVILNEYMRMRKEERIGEQE